ncbi:hypothetical protein LTR15_010432 [Elasticomyces elasticus]|nr:hypothetical protein LTR15_010432 [Elasticomyces elasticus]
METPIEELYAIQSRAIDDLKHARAALASAIQALRNITAIVDAEKAKLKAINLRGSWWYQADLFEAETKCNAAGAEQATASQHVCRTTKNASMSEEQLMAVSRLIHDAKVRQTAADRLAEAQQAEDEARRLADARELEARQREVKRRQNDVTARIVARRAAQEREAKARKAAEEKAKQEREWKEESRRAEYEWRQEEYRKQQHAKEQSSESNKRRRLIDETTNAPLLPLLRITRDKILEWHKTCEGLKDGDKSTLRSFPQPPYEICVKESCAAAEKTRAVKACRRNSKSDYREDSWKH